MTERIKIALVSLAEAKSWLRLDQDNEDGTVTILVQAASEAILTTAEAWDGTGDVPNRLKLACLMRVAAAFDGREEIGVLKGEDQLLSPFRVMRV